MNDNRIGRFTIDRKLIMCTPKAALAILSGCIVVRAECTWYANRIEYTALCDQFDDVSIGDICPEYQPQIKDLVGGKYHVTWIRKRTT